MRHRIALAIVSLLLLASGPFGSAYSQPLPKSSPPDGLAGQLLVASERMIDPNFRQTVIYVIAHSGEGAMGLIVNRKAAAIQMKRLLEEVGIKARSSRRLDVYFGGPVEIARGFVLHSPDYEGVSTMLQSARLSLSTGTDVLRAMATGRGPRKARFVLGYAGWGRGQLEQEIARVDWLLAPADAELIFAGDPGTVWKRALQRAGMRI